jgi:hypothetical protein
MVCAFAPCLLKQDAGSVHRGLNALLEAAYRDARSRIAVRLPGGLGSVPKTQNAPMEANVLHELMGLKLVLILLQTVVLVRMIADASGAQISRNARRFQLLMARRFQIQVVRRLRLPMASRLQLPMVQRLRLRMVRSYPRHNVAKIRTVAMEGNARYRVVGSTPVSLHPVAVAVPAVRDVSSAVIISNARS